MRPLISLFVAFGRPLYALAVLGLGLEILLLKAYPKGLLPVPASLSGTAPAVGAALVLLAGLLLLDRAQRLAAGGLALAFGAAVLTLHLPRLGFTMAQAGAWTPTFEMLSLAAGALALTAGAGPTRSSTLDFPRPPGPLFRLGQVLLAVSLVVFGVLHVLFAQFVATLVPAWIPGHLFWAYFVGGAFLASALSLLLKRQVAWTTAALGLMFGLWVVLVHAPRVVQKPTVEAEWTSLLVALVMCGASWSMGRYAIRAPAADFSVAAGVAAGQEPAVVDG